MKTEDIRSFWEELARSIQVEVKARTGVLLLDFSFDVFAAENDEDDYCVARIFVEDIGRTLIADIPRAATDDPELLAEIPGLICEAVELALESYAPATITSFSHTLH